MREDTLSLLGLTTGIVSSYVAYNRIQAADISALIANTHAALGAFGSVPASVAPEPPMPAVPIRKSVTPDAIICLEDGKSFRILKRHLRVAFNMSPDEYRAKWGLPHDYPMIAPNYVEVRSAMAKRIGLGRKAGQKAARKPR